ncbi:protein of unknown function [Agrobacterium pusense]|uniref:Uncharacterized protein n=1 Tax=Agrobacterium pusense TaxID=648995 RepID=U4PVA1_9HYPH|nr:protein of unknown function [Agrobacterium pusense]
MTGGVRSGSHGPDRQEMEAMMRRFPDRDASDHRFAKKLQFESERQVRWRVKDRSRKIGRRRKPCPK